MLKIANFYHVLFKGENLGTPEAGGAILLTIFCHVVRNEDNPNGYERFGGMFRFVSHTA